MQILDTILCSLASFLGKLQWRHIKMARKIDFLKICVFRIILVNSLGNLQILPMVNVRHFRRIRKNGGLFLKMCVLRINYAAN